MRRLLTSTLALAVVTIPAAGYSNGYTYQRSITVANSVAPSTLTNFPMLVTGKYSYLATVAHGGLVNNTATSNGQTIPTDLIFTSDAAGANLLNWEIASYAPTTGQIEAWIQIPSLSNGTVIYMFYGKASVTTYQGGSVGAAWSGFAGVWHFGSSASLSLNDSTSNGNNGTVNGATASTGIIDGGPAFSSGSSQYISVPNASNLDTANVSFSFWVNRESLSQSQYAHPIGKGTGNGAPYGSYYSQFNNSGSNSTEANVCIGMSDASITCYDYGAGAFASTGWNLVTATYNSSTGVLSAYKNGALSGTTTASGSKTINPDNGPLSFGRQPTYGQYFSGDIDEVEILPSVLSANWIATMYNNQSNPSAFYAISSATTMGAAGRAAVTIIII